MADGSSERFLRENGCGRSSPERGGPMIRMLASVRNLDEARDAAGAGADLIDLKEPGAGALGAVSAPQIARIVHSLRAEYPRLPISAAIGDLLPGDSASLEFRASQ